MKKLGWGGSAVLSMFIVGAMGVSANAGYVLSLSGPSQAAPGETIFVLANLASNAEDTHDSMNWDAVFAGPRSLLYNGYSLASNVQYQVGSPDDFSVPKGALDTGVVTPSVPVILSTAPQPGVNLHIEAITRSGMTFGSGLIAAMSLTVPADAQLLEEFSITPVPDTFANGFDTIDTASGGAYRFVVVPEPMTLALLGLGGLFAARRRFAA